MTFIDETQKFFGVHESQDWADSLERWFQLALPVLVLGGAGFAASRGALAISGRVLDLLLSLVGAIFDPTKLVRGAVDTFNAIDIDKAKEAAQIAKDFELDKVAAAAAKLA